MSDAATYQCLLCGQTTPMPHVCPVFAAAESPESRGERPNRLVILDALRHWLKTHEHEQRSAHYAEVCATLAVVEADVTLPPQRSDETGGEAMGDAALLRTIAETMRHTHGIDERGVHQRFVRFSPAVCDRLLTIAAEVTTLRAQLAEARKVLRDFATNYDHEEQTHQHQPFKYGGGCRVCMAEAALAAVHPTEENR